MENVRNTSLDGAHEEETSISNAAAIGPEQSIDHCSSSNPDPVSPEESSAAADVYAEENEKTKANLGAADYENQGTDGLNTTVSGPSTNQEPLRPISRQRSGPVSDDLPSSSGHDEQQRDEEQTMKETGENNIGNESDGKDSENESGRNGIENGYDENNIEHESNDVVSGELSEIDLLDCERENTISANNVEGNCVSNRASEQGQQRFDDPANPEDSVARNEDAEAIDAVELQLEEPSRMPRTGKQPEKNNEDNNGRNEKEENDDDDDVIVVESHITGPTDTASRGTVSEKVSLSSPNLPRMMVFRRNEQGGDSSAVSIAPANFIEQGEITALPGSAQRHVSLPPPCRPAFSALLPSVQKTTVGIPNANIFFSRLVPAARPTANINGNSPLRPATVVSNIASVRTVPACVQPQPCCGRQILPKAARAVSQAPAVIDIRNQRVETQAVRQDSALPNGNGMVVYDAGQETSSHSSTPILNPASVLPYHYDALPKEHGFLTPEGGYRCETCGDSFALKSCLEFHLQRRSMAIECTCVMCQQPLVFFNKCVYYAHIRQHGGTNNGELDEMVMRNVNIKPISWELMELTFEDTAFKRMLDPSKFFEYETGRLANFNSAPNEEASKNVNPANNESSMSKPLENDGAENQANTAANALALKLYTAANGTSDRRTTQSTSDRRTTCRVCSECNTEFPSASSLRQHFMHNLPTNQKQLVCPTCQAAYFSHCSFNAHVRTHSSSAPHTCAECGAVEATSQLLNLHLVTHQKTPTVINAWRCQKCPTFYSNLDSLIMHIISGHCSASYRCQHCPKAFTSPAEVLVHSRSQHENIGFIPSKDVRQLIKCCECDVLYVSREPLLEHLKIHFSNLTPFLVYRCAICGRLMENRIGLVRHLRTVHGSAVSSNLIHPVKIHSASITPTTLSPNKKSSISSPCKSTPEIISSPEASGVQKTLGGTSTTSTPISETYSCSRCPDTMFNTKAGLKSHVRRRHRQAGGGDATAAKKPRHGIDEHQQLTSAAQARHISLKPVAEIEQTCRYCMKRFSSNSQLLEDGLRHLSTSINVCLLCHNRDIGTTALLHKHLQRHVELQSQSRNQRGQFVAFTFTCDAHCGGVFSSPESALIHLRNIHSLAPFYCHQCAISFSVEEDFRSHMTEHEGGSTCNSATENETISEGRLDHQMIDGARLTSSSSVETTHSLETGVPKNTNNSAGSANIDSSSQSAVPVKCNKCGEQFDDLQSMRSHSTSHKEAKYYLCLDCGLSFAAVSSLGRHLIMAHRIPNVDKYLEEQPSANPDKGNELECTVCHKEFSSKPLLDAHVRTHGLLFLRTVARPNT